MTTVVPEQLQVGPWFTTAKFWKRASVFFSIALSAASLIFSAISSLSPQQESTLNASVVVNSVSIMISALTSLDWRKQATHDKHFAAQLLKVTHTHEGESIVITAKTILSDMSPS